MRTDATSVAQTRLSIGVSAVRLPSRPPVRHGNRNRRSLTALLFVTKRATAWMLEAALNPTAVGTKTSRDA